MLGRILIASMQRSQPRCKSHSAGSAARFRPPRGRFTSGEESQTVQNGRIIMEKTPEGFNQGTQGLVYRENLIFEQTAPGRVGYSLPEAEVPEVSVEEAIPAHLLRDEV